ncbi:MAG: polysaccharide deacetylase family protein [Acidobacteria bacterium]|nr:polysaccharide deacetylase family protein [Acidobacteriota bacterium]
MRSVWLMYHDIHDGAPAPDLPASATVYHVSRRTFGEHLAAIRASGLRLAKPREALSGNFPDSVVITFDDGWQGSFRFGVPMLAGCGWPGVLFITRDFVGKPGFCTPQMIAEAARSGMEIGVHGTTHRMLSGRSRPEVLEEFRACKEYLESLLAKPVTCASLPGGDVNRTILDCARELGLECLCTSEPGIHPASGRALGVRRIAVRVTTSPAAIARYCRMDVRRERARWLALETPRRLIGMRNYVRLRRWLLDRRAGARVLWRP